MTIWIFMKWIVLQLILCVWVTTSSGQDNGLNVIDIELNTCLEADANSSTLAMVGCIKQAEQKWDSELNKNYTQLSGLLTASRQTLLKNAQRKWIEFRDLELSFSNKLYSDTDGTLYSLIASQRKLELTRQRALELAAYIKIFNGE